MSPYCIVSAVVVSGECGDGGDRSIARVVVVVYRVWWWYGCGGVGACGEGFRKVTSSTPTSRDGGGVIDVIPGHITLSSRLMGSTDTI